MKKIAPEDPETQSPDLVAENIAKLRELFPELLTEGKDGASVNVDVLKQLVGDRTVTDAEEKFGLNWYRKRKSRQLALTPTTGTLRPCPEDSVNWDGTKNLMIEGDNLEVLKLLQKSYAGKVKLIYIDPPYNTGSDFVYPDNYRDSILNYLQISGQVDARTGRTTSANETSGRFHTKWLNMMYPRLHSARNLLSKDGVICISIDDTEEPRIRMLCDEIFGEENHVATIMWQKRYVSNVTAKWLSDMHDYIVVYAREKEHVAVNSWDRTEEQLAAYKNPDDDSRGKWRAQDLSASRPYSAGVFTITGPTGLKFNPPPNRYWRCNREQFEEWNSDNRIWWGVNRDARPMLKSFLEESERGMTPNTWWTYEFAGHNKEATLELKELFGGDAPFDTPKPVRLMVRLIELFCEDDQIVLDFFSGSGAFAHGCMRFNDEFGRNIRWIQVQLPETTSRKDYTTIFEIACERLRRASTKLESNENGSKSDLGFRVFKLASTNIREWEPKREALGEELEDAIDHLKTDRTEQDILFELLLKLGLDLCVPIEEREIAGKTVHNIGAGTLLACLSEEIRRNEVEKLALGIAQWHAELAPAGETQCLFRDSAFADDVAKSNLAAILEQHGLKNVRSL